MKDDNASRFAQLSDYLRALRESWWIVVLLALVAAGAAYFFSNRQPLSYHATASISYTDERYDLSLLGSPVTPASTAPATGLPARAAQITNPPVVSAVSKALTGQLPPSAVAGSVRASADQKSGLVLVTGQSSNAQLAAKIANLFAGNAAAITNLHARQRFAVAARVLNVQLHRVIGAGPEATASRASLIDQITRLNFLKNTIAPATVVSFAQVPGAPVSRNTQRNTILAAFVGLLIGLLLVLLRHGLDRRLRGSVEIQQSLDYSVLGRIRSESLEKVFDSDGKAKRDVGPDIDAFHIVRQNLGYLGERNALRSILVTSAVPEEGKSSVAVSLAFAIASTGSRTLLLECDMRRPTLAKRFGLSYRPGLAEYLSGTADLQDVLREIPVAANGAKTSTPGTESSPSSEVASNALVGIPAGTPTRSPVDLLESERFKAFLRELSVSYDTVILDTCPLLVVADTLTLLPQVDGVILCVRSSHTTREQARAAKDALSHFPRLPTGVVITGLPARTEEDSYSYYAYASPA